MAGGRWRVRRGARRLGAVVGSLVLGGAIVLVATTAAGASPSSPPTVTRIYGTDAIGTSIAVSQAEFPVAGSAKAVVLARSDFFSDALAGGPLAAKVGGPLLITPGASLSSVLDPRVQAEIQRVLPVGGTVYILGGDLALSPNIDAQLQALGYVTQRIAGANEFATAVDIAEVLGNPSTIFEATGLNFPDALSAVPAAIETKGAILLTDGTTQSPQTAAYLAAHPNDTRYAIGGPLAAYGADPSATPVYGADLYGTSAAVAATFFPQATVFGAATGANFPDALSGGVFMGSPGVDGPVLLVPPSGPLPGPVSTYLAGAAATLVRGYLFGGPLAVGDDVLSELESLGQSTSAPPLTITTTELPGATVGIPYTGALAASGGTPPYSWALVSGSLPPGLNLSPAGVISGTPDSPGSFAFTVQVTDSTAPTAQSASQALSISVSAPAITVTTVATSNWSGYIVGNGPYASVTGTFNVPSLVSGTPVGDAMAAWVGIDGWGNTSLIQAGISEFIDPYNPNYFVIQPWWEILPAPPVDITSMVVSAGDEVTVTIGQVGGTDWSISLTDDTNGERFVTDQTYTGPASSAEWIVEAPSVNGSPVGLATYSPPVTFDGLGIAGPETTLTEAIMVQDGVAVSTPSPLSSNGFTVAYGSVAPAAP